MSEGAFTPGPWTVQPGPWSGIKGPHVMIGPADAVTSIAAAFGQTEDEQRANARLIAAAPELLGALAALFEHCAMVHKHWGDGNNLKEADAAIRDARALLARVQGEG